ncbi:unnamed protein product [Parnassius apollo]|uniref:(apollo) hypothetical protein n=1 Tax=Parnassius apollo TaxID=110799 RepID=A0A8S3YBT9_PARAO|nr:unnamed protein product [Parnassius apollo]
MRCGPAPTRTSRCTTPRRSVYTHTSTRVHTQLLVPGVHAAHARAVNLHQRAPAAALLRAGPYTRTPPHASTHNYWCLKSTQRTHALWTCTNARPAPTRTSRCTTPRRARTRCGPAPTRDLHQRAPAAALLRAGPTRTPPHTSTHNYWCLESTQRRTRCGPAPTRTSRCTPRHHSGLGPPRRRCGPAPTAPPFTHSTRQHTVPGVRAAHARLNPPTCVITSTHNYSVPDPRHARCGPHQPRPAPTRTTLHRCTSSVHTQLLVPGVHAAHARAVALHQRAPAADSAPSVHAHLHVHTTTGAWSHAARARAVALHATRTSRCTTPRRARTRCGPAPTRDLHQRAPAAALLRAGPYTRTPPHTSTHNYWCLESTQRTHALWPCTNAHQPLHYSAPVRTLAHLHTRPHITTGAWSPRSARTPGLHQRAPAAALLRAGPYTRTPPHTSTHNYWCLESPQRTHALWPCTNAHQPLHYSAPVRTHAHLHTRPHITTGAWSPRSARTRCGPAPTRTSRCTTPRRSRTTSTRVHTQLLVPGVHAAHARAVDLHQRATCTNAHQPLHYSAPVRTHAHLHTRPHITTGAWSPRSARTRCEPAPTRTSRCTTPRRSVHTYTSTRVHSQLLVPEVHAAHARAVDLHQRATCTNAHQPLHYSAAVRLHAHLHTRPHITTGAWSPRSARTRCGPAPTRTSRCTTPRRARTRCGPAPTRDLHQRAPAAALLRAGPYTRTPPHTSTHNYWCLESTQRTHALWPCTNAHQPLHYSAPVRTHAHLHTRPHITTGAWSPRSARTRCGPAPTRTSRCTTPAGRLHAHLHTRPHITTGAWSPRSARTRCGPAPTRTSRCTTPRRSVHTHTSTRVHTQLLVPGVHAAHARAVALHQRAPAAALLRAGPYTRTPPHASTHKYWCLESTQRTHALWPCTNAHQPLHYFAPVRTHTPPHASTDHYWCLESTQRTHALWPCTNAHQPLHYSAPVRTHAHLHTRPHTTTAHARAVALHQRAPAAALLRAGPYTRTPPHTSTHNYWCLESRARARTRCGPAPTRTSRCTTPRRSVYTHTSTRVHTQLLVPGVHAAHARAVTLHQRAPPLHYSAPVRTRTPPHASTHNYWCLESAQRTHALVNLHQRAPAAALLRAVRLHAYTSTRVHSQLLVPGVHAAHARAVDLHPTRTSRCTTPRRSVHTYTSTRVHSQLLVPGVHAAHARAVDLTPAPTRTSRCTTPRRARTRCGPAPTRTSRCTTSRRSVHTHTSTRVHTQILVPGVHAAHARAVALHQRAPAAVLLRAGPYTRTPPHASTHNYWCLESTQRTHALWPLHQRAPAAALLRAGPYTRTPPHASTHNYWCLECTTQRTHALWPCTNAHQPLHYSAPASHYMSSAYCGTREGSRFLVTGGSDQRIRYWDLEHPEDSYVLVHAPGDQLRSSPGAVKYRSRIIDGTTVIQECSKLNPSAPISIQEDNVYRTVESRTFYHTAPITDITMVEGNKCYLVSSSADGVINVWK